MAASAVSASASGTTFTYVITDMSGNTVTVTAVPNGVTFASSASPLLTDGQGMLSNLLLLLQTGQRPLTFANSPSAFYQS